VYVGRRASDFTFASADAARTEALAGQVAELGIVRAAIEEAERPWRLQAERERLARVGEHAAAGGRLLDVGCSLGSFVEVARETFDVVGVEPDQATASQARGRGLPVRTGTLETIVAPRGGFDVVTMFHVIEHLSSPRVALARVRELLAPGGIAVIETPTVDSLWFRAAPRRWRQLIPDHYFFFSRATLERLLRESGLQPVAFAKVGRRASLRFVADRVRRSGVPLTGRVPMLLELAGIADRTIYVNPGDIMSLVARLR
jgi:2-polyprenyl-3-methyl-5-hydroxy-6-metoxy-1,4-benzoquinol methylase